MAKKPTPKNESQTAAPLFSFDLEEGVAVPPRSKEVPDYGIQFAALPTDGSRSVMVPYAQVPKEHIRLLVQRFGRDNKATFTTREEKDANGAKIGIRIWRGADKPAETAAAE